MPQSRLLLMPSAKFRASNRVVRHFLADIVASLRFAFHPGLEGQFTYDVRAERRTERSPWGILLLRCYRHNFQVPMHSTGLTSPIHNEAIHRKAAYIEQLHNYL